MTTQGVLPQGTALPFDKREGGTDLTLIDSINRLRKEKNAVILAHYYQVPEIQELADFVGDSLELARIAQKSQAKIIVFAGVHFMAEGAKILNPQARVFMPDLRAGCSLSDSCPPDALAKFRSQNPDVFVVSYINTSAAVKALSDVICTSSNAVKIIRQVPANKKILFAPDRNLGAWVIKQTGREMILWQGSCIVHETFSEKRILDLLLDHPDAQLIAHPECEPSLLEHAHFIGSTSQLLRYAGQVSHSKWIVATEEGILHQMKKLHPQKIFIAAPPNQTSCSCNECPFMKLNTIEKIHAVLEHETNEILIPEDLRLKALKPLERMLEWSK